ncbi:MAG TPA: hypothetical protein VJV78_43935 [Polyangiales bacterium]|nr:hypothetical protein [Polyangiales bacterium]
MLTLLTTENFSAWYRALGDEDAEEVATGLELLQELLPDREPPGSRDILLWFESSSGNPRIDGRFDDDFLAFSRRVHQFVQHLSSEPVQRGLRDTNAERASAAVESILKQARLQRYVIGKLGNVRQALQEVERQYLAILDSIGIPEPPPPPAATSSLRELNLRAREPHIRVLYGVDAVNQRALIVLGEHLDRTAYGPSVRKALGLWREFLSDSKPAVRERVW